jgi:hypothetical protein
MSREGSERPHPQLVVAVTAITLLGLGLRWASWHNSLFGDELSTYSIVTGNSPRGILHVLNGHSVDLNPPGLFILAWLSERLGQSPELLRLPSILAGVLTIPLTYVLGTRTVGQRAGLIGAVFVALSPFLIYYSTEARAYALVTFLVLASALALASALDGAGKGSWAAYALLSAASMYVHYTAVFALGALLIWAAVTHPRQIRALVLANVAAIVLFAPWLPALVHNTHSFGTNVFSILEPFGLRAVVNDVAHWSIGHPYMALADEPGPGALALIGAGLVMGVLLAGYTWWRGRRGRPDAGLSLILVLALLPPLGLAVYSAVGKDTWDARNLTSSWPALALAAGALLAAPRPRFAVIPVTLVLAGFGVGAITLQQADHQRPDYAAAARLVITAGTPADPVAIVPAPTGGPYAGMDAALAYAGMPGRPLLRIGSPPIGEVLRAPPYALLATTPARVLAAQTFVARGNGKLFVVAPGTAPVDQLLRSGAVDVRRAFGPWFGTGTTGALFGTVFKPLSDYMRALSPRLTPVSTVTLPGFLRLSVYVYRRR